MVGKPNQYPRWSMQRNKGYKGKSIGLQVASIHYRICSFTQNKYPPESTCLRYSLTWCGGSVAWQVVQTQSCASTALGDGSTTPPPHWPHRRLLRWVPSSVGSLQRSQQHLEIQYFSTHTVKGREILKQFHKHFTIIMRDAVWYNEMLYQ